ncbi:hypothetical protein [Blastochloris sulfoviridis]|uniref:Uncharacterized protein n=1 Tax=Blastochloris sulfoviridis TaxID=50712 RepID=A0A5M6HWQ8_9HYPH|nr:hypothetical protein [Blastochloris sulfoviridis]KAA5600350.1 hypothetical protein F1193_10615 [Blastochloris sulfoviridis]NJL08905.1 hypothetical protein [Candidatus Methylacidiphilales bacterium]
MSEDGRDARLLFEHLSTMSLVQIIAYLEDEARRVSSVAGYCLSMARLELEQAHAHRPSDETRKSLN